LANQGAASFTGVTVNFMNNQASGGAGGRGGNSATGTGGTGGAGAVGGDGGEGAGGIAGNGGLGGSGLGGAISNARSAILTIDPRLGSRKGSRQSRAANTITANQATLGLGGSAGMVGAGQAGQGGAPNGAPGSAVPGTPGLDGRSGAGLGGGLFRSTGDNATIANTNITGNHASTADNDESVLAIV
jgi:hypothetical protein